MALHLFKFYWLFVNLRIWSYQVGGERDGKVREWERWREEGRESTVYIVFFQLSQCVMTHNMANYLQIEEDSDAKGMCMYVHTIL